MDVAPLKPMISAEDLAKIDVRVGTILSVHDVEGSRKLVRLAVAFGDRTRDVVAGLKTERADVAALAGRQALFVVNLPPRTMAGVLSEAMLFAAMRTRSRRCWRCLRHRCRTVRGPDNKRDR